MTSPYSRSALEDQPTIGCESGSGLLPGNPKRRTSRHSTANTAALWICLALFAPQPSFGEFFTIPFFTGPEADAFGICVKPDGSRWQSMRTSDFSNFENLLPNAWDAGNGEWNPGVHRFIRYEPDAILYTSDNQVNSVIVYTVRGDGFAAVSGMIVFDGTGLDSGDADPVKIRSEVIRYRAGPSGAGTVLAGFQFNAPAGTDGAWDLGAETALGQFPVNRGERIAITTRKVGAPGTLRSDVSEVIISAPAGADIVPVTEVNREATTGLSFPTESGKRYRLQYESGANWLDLPVIVKGTGANEVAFDPFGYDPQKTYRALEFQTFGGMEPPPGEAAFLDVTASKIAGLSIGVAAWGDFNNDGFSDIADGGHVWKNNNGSFFSQFSGTAILGWADLNNDGFLDGYGWADGAPQNRGAYFSNGATSFSFVAFPNLHPLIELSLGLSFGDFNGDSYVDLYIGGYEQPAYEPDVILRNNSGSTFSINWQESGSLRPGRGVTSCDWDEDGDLDIFVSNYRLELNMLWRNNGSGALTDVAAAMGADGADPSFGAAHTIGSAWGDLDNDGDFDLFVGNFAHDSCFTGGTTQPQSQFLRNNGSPGWDFTDMAATAGLHYQESYASPALADFDNDGDLDLFMTVALDFAVCPASTPNHPVLYRNDGGWSFTDVTGEEGLAGLPRSEQAGWGDFDNDGDLDLVTEGRLYENQNQDNSFHWLKIKLVGNGSTVNKSAIGAQVRIAVQGQTLSRQVQGGTGQRNYNDLVLHFGLGNHDEPVDIDVIWPGGSTQTVQDIAVDQQITVTQS
jgi:hypothetical protein